MFLFGGVLGWFAGCGPALLSLMIVCCVVSFGCFDSVAVCISLCLLCAI